MSLARDERVFIVRMWLEPDAPERAWRGCVQELATGRKLYLAFPGEIADFIALRLSDRAEPTEV